MTDNREDRDDILAARAADAMARLASVAKGKDMSEWEDESGSRIHQTTDDRSWWKTVYRAGIKADLQRQPRIPPDDLTADQKEVWLAGYDR